MRPKPYPTPRSPAPRRRPPPVPRAGEPRPCPLQPPLPLLHRRRRRLSPGDPLGCSSLAGATVRSPRWSAGARTTTNVSLRVFFFIFFTTVGKKEERRRDLVDCSYVCVPPHTEALRVVHDEKVGGDTGRVILFAACAYCSAAPMRCASYSSGDTCFHVDWKNLQWVSGVLAHTTGITTLEQNWRSASSVTAELIPGCKSNTVHPSRAPLYGRRRLFYHGTTHSPPSLSINATPHSFHAPGIHQS